MILVSSDGVRFLYACSERARGSLCYVAPNQIRTWSDVIDKDCILPHLGEHMRRKFV